MGGGNGARLRRFEVPVLSAVIHTSPSFNLKL
jgi:hypothetical protein